MNIKDCAKYVGERFVYRYDPKILDFWSVMSEKEDGKMYGDCEDFSLTTFWLHSNKNIFLFLFRLLITHQYALYHCVTVKGEKHAIGSYDGLWFDNWTREAVTKEVFFERTKHRIRFRMINILMILPLTLGLFFKSKK